MGDWKLRSEEPWPHDADLDVETERDEALCRGCGAGITGVSDLCGACYDCVLCGCIGPGCCDEKGVLL